MVQLCRTKHKISDLFRKIRAMSLYKEVCPLSYIQQILGHENIYTTTRFYAFVTLAKAREQTNPYEENIEKTGKIRKYPKFFVGICCIIETPHRFWLFKICELIGPIVSPGLAYFGEFSALFFIKTLSSSMEISSVGAAYTRFKSAISGLISL